MAFKRKILFFFLLTFALTNTSLSRSPVIIGVSSNFLETMKLLKKEFAKVNPLTLSLVSGPTGLLYAQIKRGAPLDLFFSADDKRPRKLEEEGLTHPGGIFVYAYGSLVLVRKKGSPLPLDLKLLKKRKGPFPLMAIANPKTAPFGEAGLETLKSHGLYERMESEGKLIRGENAGKAFYYVSSGHVDLGLVSKSFVLDPQKSSLIGGFSEVLLLIMRELDRRPSF